MQNSLLDLQNRYASLSKTGDPLERLKVIVDWEIFLPILVRIDKKERQNPAERKPSCRILMFKNLYLGQCLKTCCPADRVVSVQAGQVFTVGVNGNSA